MLLTNRKENILAALLVFVVITIAACKYDKEELLYPGNNPPADCATVPASFNAQILPLVLSRCSISNCHDAATAMGGLAFRNYNDISAAKIRIHTQVVVQKTMPADGPLSDAEINMIRCWLDSGAPNN